MESVLISIQPRWCELIASGKKTVEVRKTRPKLDTPFKVYIYCTKARDFFSIGHGVYAASDELYRLPNGEIKFGDSFELAALPNVEYNGNNFLNGKVIGEFVCDEIYPIKVHSNCAVQNWIWYELSRSCLTLNEVAEYVGANKTGYGWHISDLVIYDKPKELSEFWKADKCPYASENGCTYKYHCFRSGQVKRCGETLTRPPQSWCYVEKGGGSDA